MWQSRKVIKLFTVRLFSSKCWVYLLVYSSHRSDKWANSNWPNIATYNAKIAWKHENYSIAKYKITLQFTRTWPCLWIHQVIVNDQCGRSGDQPDFNVYFLYEFKGITNSNNIINTIVTYQLILFSFFLKSLFKVQSLFIL